MNLLLSAYVLCMTLLPSAAQADFLLDGPTAQSASFTVSLQPPKTMLRVRPSSAHATGSFSRGSRPLYGSTAARASSARHRSSSYRTPAPLITSREVARQAVRREVYGTYWRW